ncbi:MAG: hypothetical protein ACI9DC_003289 [Gammaproteobacteria bacterium]|jgi:hypothetical protein
MSEPGIYLIRTPLRETAGLVYGGPMRIKVGRRRVVYAGFVSVELASIACGYWNVRAEHFIERWEEAARHDSVDDRAQGVLLFQDEADFRAWLQDPESFDLQAHVVSLHFALRAGGI